MVEPRDYTLIAPLYDKIFSRPLGEGHQLIGKLLGTHPRKKILEIGVGSGLTLEHITNHDFTGIDINEDMLYQAQIKVLGRHNIKLHLMNAENLKFRDNQFDIVLAPSVLSAVINPEKVFKEMVRVTRPGGTIVVIANFADDAKVLSRILDPLTRSFLGFRMDLELDFYRCSPEVKLVERRKINQFANYHLSWFQKFKKQN